MPSETNPVARCRWCQHANPGRRGFMEYNGETYHRFRQDCVLHPLIAIFGVAAINRTEGMNWLQDRGKISDNCSEVWEIAPCDLDDILEEAGFHFNPAWIALVRKVFEEKSR